MKIETYNPKFHPKDKVLFTKTEGVVILSTIEYCMFDKRMPQWFYYITGFQDCFAEDKLTQFTLKGSELLFTYED